MYKHEEGKFMIKLSELFEDCLVLVVTYFKLLCLNLLLLAGLVAVCAIINAIYSCISDLFYDRNIENV